MSSTGPRDVPPPTPPHAPQVPPAAPHTPQVPPAAPHAPQVPPTPPHALRAPPPTPRRTPRRSVARIAFQVIHRHRLWRFFGLEGAELVSEAISHEMGATAAMSISYFQWLKSRYLAQRMLGLSTSHLVRLTAADKANLRGLRSQNRI